MILNNISQSEQNLDKFDLIIKVQRCYGLQHYKYNQKNSKSYYILNVCYQLFIFAIIINFCTPCLIHNFDCHYKFLVLKYSYILSFRQIMFYFVIRNVNAIISSIIYSLKGEQQNDYKIYLHNQVIHMKI